MKVIPHIKRNPLKANEVRVITIDENALNELLFENLMEHQEDYFNIDGLCDDIICTMNWDRRRGLLTYAVMPIKYRYDGCSLNYDYLQQKIGVTTSSLFRPKRYRSFTLNEKMLVRETQKRIVGYEE